MEINGMRLNCTSDRLNNYFSTDKNLISPPEFPICKMGVILSHRIIISSSCLQRASLEHSYALNL